MQANHAVEGERSLARTSTNADWDLLLLISGQDFLLFLSPSIRDRILRASSSFENFAGGFLSLNFPRGFRGRIFPGPPHIHSPFFLSFSHEVSPQTETPHLAQSQPTEPEFLRTPTVFSGAAACK